MTNVRLTDELDLAPEPRSIRDARAFLVELSRRVALPDDALAVAELALSEIVTNAIVHGEPPIRVRVAVDPAGVHVAVSDACPAGPQAGTPTADATGGRGLAIVAAVAGTWGCVPDPDGRGKLVWFRVCA